MRKSLIFSGNQVKYICTGGHNTCASRKAAKRWLGGGGRSFRLALEAYNKK